MNVAWHAPDGTNLAWAGALHPSHADLVDRPLYLATVDLDSLAAVAAPAAVYRRLPRLGAVVRDLAVVLPPDVTYGNVAERLARVVPPVPATFLPVDRYAGPPLGAGESSLTVRVTLQPDERTLTEDEIEAYRRALIAALGGLVRIR
jgi:phenylalanyl-tRNA synthetase beta chain